MGNTCKSMADSFQCMTKPTTIKKNGYMCDQLSFFTDSMNLCMISLYIAYLYRD